MSGFEVAGLVLGVFPLLFSGVQKVQPALKWLHDRRSRIRDVYHRDGLTAVLLLNLLPEASSVAERIGEVLSGTEADLSAFRQSLTSNMNMVAVAGAIVAQIGITGLSLTGIDQAHWTAAAFLIASLVLGVLSVYVSFIVQQEVLGLVGQVDFMDWLSRPLTMEELLEKAYAISHHPAFAGNDRPSGPSSSQTQEITQLEHGAAALTLKREASVLAAIMLATPSSPLGLSLNAFIFGLGIYLGCVYTDELVQGFGKGGSLGVLIFCIIAATIGAFLYTFPRILKSLEKYDAKKTRQYRAQLSSVDSILQSYQANQAQ